MNSIDLQIVSPLWPVGPMWNLPISVSLSASFLGSIRLMGWVTEYDQDPAHGESPKGLGGAEQPWLLLSGVSAAGLSSLGLLCERRWWEVQTQSLNDLLQFKQSVSCGLWAFAHNPCFLSCSLGISCRLGLSKANTCTDRWAHPLPPPARLPPLSCIICFSLFAESFAISIYIYINILYSLSHPKKKRSVSWPYIPSSFSLKTISVTQQLHLNCCLLKSPVPSTVVKPNDHDSISTTQQESADPSFFLETLFFSWLPWHYILLIISQGLLC